MGATPLSRRPKLTTRSVRMLTDADIATVILFIYFFIAADASKIQRWVFFESEREGKKGRGATEGGGRRPRPGAAAAAATAKNPRPKKLLKSRGGARRNASSDTRAQAAQ